MTRQRQLHLWITDHDYSLLRELAEERKETLSSVIRRLIKANRPEPMFPTASSGDTTPVGGPPVV
jgi:hypothetical protein